jgi:hypothetical protein
VRQAIVRLRHRAAEARAPLPRVLAATPTLLGAYAVIHALVTWDAFGAAHAFTQACIGTFATLRPPEGGITVVSATAGAFGGARVARDLGAWLQRLGAGPWADGLSITLVVAIVSVLSLVLGELVPKSLALRYAEGYSLIVGRVILGLSTCMALAGEIPARGRRIDMPGGVTLEVVDATPRRVRLVRVTRVIPTSQF